VRIYKAEEQGPKITEPQFAPMTLLPGQQSRARNKWQAYVAGLFGRP